MEGFAFQPSSGRLTRQTTNRTQELEPMPRPPQHSPTAPFRPLRNSPKPLHSVPNISVDPKNPLNRNMLSIFYGYPVIAWGDEILAWHRCGRPSNGRLEGANNLLQVPTKSRPRLHQPEQLRSPRTPPNMSPHRQQQPLQSHENAKGQVGSIPPATCGRRRVRGCELMVWIPSWRWPLRGSAVEADIGLAALSPLP